MCVIKKLCEVYFLRFSKINNNNNKTDEKDFHNILLATMCPLVIH